VNFDQGSFSGMMFPISSIDTDIMNYVYEKVNQKHISTLAS